MSPIVELMITNAVAAFVLSIVVFLVARKWKNCFVVHFLWLIVLVKLITPPVWQVALPVLSSTDTANTATVVASIPSETPADWSKVESHRSPSTANATSKLKRQNQKPAIAAENSPVASTASNQENDSVSAIPVAVTRGWDYQFDFTWDRGLWLVWLIGAVLLAGATVRRVLMFDRIISQLTQQDAHWQARCESLARKMKLRKLPEVRTTNAQISPMIWCLRWTPIMVLPINLLEALSKIQADQIIVHELAHLQRRTQWTRWFELIVTTVYWWFPIMWIARSQMHRADEACCDSIVLKQFPGESNNYGVSLIRSAEFLQKSSSRVPLAVSFNQYGSLKERMDMITSNRSAIEVSHLSKVLLGLFACVVLAVSAKAIASAPAAVIEPSEESTVVVVSDPSFDPVEGATVTVYINKTPTTFHTDAEGKCDIGHFAVAPKKLTVDVVAKGYVPMRGSWASPPVRELPRRLNFQLQPGTTMGGVIVDESSQPVQGAKVVFRLSKRRSPDGHYYLTTLDFETETDAQGKWTCDRCPAGKDFRYSSIKVTHENYATRTDRKSRRNLEQMRNLSYRTVVQRGYRIHGVVTDATGTPLANAYGVVGFGRGVSMLGVTTDDNGRYEIEGMTSGLQPVTFLHKGYAPTMTEVDINGADIKVDFQLQTGKSTTIKVSDTSGNPIAGATVLPFKWRTNMSMRHLFPKVHSGKTNAAGIFQWKNAPEEKVIYNVSADGFTTSDGQVSFDKNVFSPQVEEYSVVLHRQLNVVGKVVDKVSKQPIEKFKVIRGKSRGREFSWHTWPRIQGYDGEFRWTQTDDKPLNAFRIEAEGYRSFTTREVALSEGSANLAIEIERAESRRIAMLAPDGGQVESAKVFVCRPGSNSGPYVQEGAVVLNEYRQQQLRVDNGSFTLPPQDTNFMLLIFADQGYGRVTGKELSGTKQIQLQAWARVEGTAKIGSKPAANKRITLDLKYEPSSYHFDYSATTDEDGRFVFERVPPEFKDVAISRSIRIYTDEVAGGGIGGRVGIQSISLEAGKTTTVNLGGFGRPVVGKIVCPKGTPKPKGDWNARTPELYRKTKTNKYGKEYYHFAIGRDGTFRIDDLPAGKYHLDVTIHDGYANHATPRRLGRRIGSIRKVFKIDQMENGRSDTPLDLGNLKLK